MTNDLVRELYWWVLDFRDLKSRVQIIIQKL